MYKRIRVEDIKIGDVISLIKNPGGFKENDDPIICVYKKVTYISHGNLANYNPKSNLLSFDGHCDALYSKNSYVFLKND